ncbi:MAG: hypothetical protein AAGE52_02385 [Myxococcota bacterium]
MEGRETLERGRPEQRERPEPEPIAADAPFRLPPPIVLPPPQSVAPAAQPGWEQAQAAVLAERVLSHVRVGGRDEVRLGLSGVLEGAEVRLKLVDGRIVPTLVGDRPQDLESLASRLAEEFAARGIDADEVEVELS